MAVVETPEQLTRAGGWLQHVTPRPGEVCWLVPEVFDAYARIFHPPMREADERDLPLRAAGESRTGVPVYSRNYGVPWREVTWREVADANSRVAHPAMQWSSITGGCTSQPGLWERAPLRNSLPLRHTRVLCEALAESTATPGCCWGAVWEGYGDVVGLRSDLQLPRLAWSNCTMILASGPLSDVGQRSFNDGFDTTSERSEEWVSVERYRSPSLWWPDDRAWCVATDVDMDTTYLGGTAKCVARLTGDARLEAMGVSSRQGITFDSDAINLRGARSKPSLDDFRPPDNRSSGSSSSTHPF